MHEKFLSCKTLPTLCTGQAISDVLNDYMTSKKIDRKKCVRLTTDGAKTMTGKSKGLAALVKPVAPLVVCCVHREALATKCIPPDLQNTLNEVVKIVNQSRSLNTRLFKTL
jgi:hypothetical protein